MKPNPNHRNTTAAGFTLTELLVVILIIVVLAALSFVGTQRMLRAARTAADMNNLRNCGVALTAFAADFGHYPIGYNWSTGQSWADVMVEENNGEDSKITQDEMFQSPLLARKIPETLEAGAVCHFGANPYIFCDSGEEDPDTGIVRPKWEIRPHNLMRPEEQFLVCSAPAQFEDIPYKACHPILWEMRGMTDGAFPWGGGFIPESDETRATRSLRLSEKRSTEQMNDPLPDFFRYGTGKGQFLFADGHIEALLPGDLEQRHLAVSY